MIFCASFALKNGMLAAVDSISTRILLSVCFVQNMICLKAIRKSLEKSAYMSGLIAELQ